MADKKLNDLFLDTLKDIYFAERKILKALPKMAKGAQSPNSRPHSKNTATRPRGMSNGSSRSSRSSASARRARHARRLRGS